MAAPQTRSKPSFAFSQTPCSSWEEGGDSHHTNGPLIPFQVKRRNLQCCLICLVWRVIKMKGGRLLRQSRWRQLPAAGRRRGVGKGVWSKTDDTTVLQTLCVYGPDPGMGSARASCSPQLTLAGYLFEKASFLRRLSRGGKMMP